MRYVIELLKKYFVTNKIVRKGFLTNNRIRAFWT